MNALSSGLLGVALLLVPATTARTRLGEVLPAPAVDVPARRGFPIRHGYLWAVGAPLTFVSIAVGFGGGTGLVAGAAAAAALLWCSRAQARRRERSGRTDPLALAAGWDLLAAGLRAGLPVPVTVRSVADEFTGTAANALRKVADLLALGADPVSAWEPALLHPETAELARAARRTARTGSGLAAVADDLAVETRATAGDHAQARAQRAAVWVTAPLGGCFLPAFLCLGVLPVVTGMVRQLAFPW